MADIITEYAKTKGEYDGRLADLNKLYEGVYKGEDFYAKVKKELVADLVGDYVFTDKAFLQKLSTENRNVFQKIYDEIKYLCKVATAGSKEARELEKVKKTFAEVYRESVKVQKNTADVDGRVYSISKTKNMDWDEQINGLFKKQGQISRNDTLVVENNTPDYLQSETIENLPLAIPLSVITKATKGKDVSHSINQGNIFDLQKGIRNADIIIKNPDRNSFAFITNIKQDGYPVLVSFLQNTEFDNDRVHKATSIHLQIDVNSMLEALPDTATIYFKNKKEFNNAVGVTNNLRSLAANVEFIDEIIPRSDADVKTQYSLSTDSEGNSLSDGQKEFFKDSKAVDENGSLKVVYHGTRNAGFTEFKRNINYFTDNKEMADSYSPNGEMYEGYVNITKPYEIDAAGERWSSIPIDEATKQFLQEYGASVFKEGGKWRTTPADIASAIEEAADNGDLNYDGIIIKNIDDTGSYYKGEEKHLGTDYIVFNSNQFKNADNVSPTASRDIRYSLSGEGLENIEKKLYNNKNPLAIVNRAKSNNNSSIKWVYKTEIFSVTENMLFHKKISEINQDSQAFQKNSIDEYMLPIDNKIVFTDGNYDSPYISEIVEVLTDYSNDFEKVKERIFNVERGKSDKEKEGRIIRQMFGDGFVISYRSEVDGVYGWEDGRRKGKTRRAVIRNYLNKHYGRRNDNQINETKADLIRSAFSLSENGENPIKNGIFNIYGNDVNLETKPTVEDIAPVMDDTPITEGEANAQASENLASLDDRPFLFAYRFLVFIVKAGKIFNHRHLFDYGFDNSIKFAILRVIGFGYKVYPVFCHKFGGGFLFIFTKNRNRLSFICFNKFHTRNVS